VEILFVVALTAFIVLLSIGVLRRSRWTFWLILIAFPVPGCCASPWPYCRYSGQMRPDGPPGTSFLQGVIGLVQVLIALAMILGLSTLRCLGIVKSPRAHESQQRIPRNGPPAARGRLRVEASSAPADHDHLARLLMLGPGLRPGEVELIKDVRAR
jgi:hypothetical protein